MAKDAFAQRHYRLGIPRTNRNSTSETQNCCTSSRQCKGSGGSFSAAACEGRQKLGPCSRKVTYPSGLGLSGNCAGAKLVQSKVQRECAAQHSGRFKHVAEQTCGRADQIFVSIELLLQSEG